MLFSYDIKCEWIANQIYQFQMMDNRNERKTLNKYKSNYECLQLRTAKLVIYAILITFSRRTMDFVCRIMQSFIQYRKIYLCDELDLAWMLRHVPKARRRKKHRQNYCFIHTYNETNGSPNQFLFFQQIRTDRTKKENMNRKRARGSYSRLCSLGKRLIWKKWNNYYKSC